MTREAGNHPARYGVGNGITEDRLYQERFSSLSVRDLLDARDTYHVHLTRKENVIATAIGSFLIRREDMDFGDHKKTREAARRRGHLKERTLANSLVRPWSWPCVLVFIKDWKLQREFRSPQSVVPPFLYLPDGRVVPVCVVRAEPADVPMKLVPPEKLHSPALGSGSAIYAMVQGQRRVGTVGCIVTDGSEYFVLTNKHVAGVPGTKILASPGGIGRPVGVSADTRGLGTESFSDVYPGLPGRDIVARIDAGLVRIDNVRDWNPQQLGIGKLGPLIDFNAETATLDWIGQKTIAFGAISGVLRGEIRALFYRYATVGGREYVSDFLIGSRISEKTPRQKEPPFLPEHGDSGLLHCLVLDDKEEEPRPFALQWGGQKLQSNGHTMYSPFALASSLGVICRDLGLTLVSDWTTDSVPYWGAVGHFKIAQQACYRVTDSALRSFLLANLERITYSDDASIWSHARQSASEFVPLADVPDVVWKKNMNKSVPQATRPNENPNHYADMDLPGADGKTLFKICGRPAKLDQKAWAAFYKNAKPPKASTKKKVSAGCLPFRVWQVFSALQDFARQGDAKGFLCAAGVLAHYVGDSCQPLHTSQHADGLDGAETGVHATYENNMVQAHGEDLAAGVADGLEKGTWRAITVESGYEAGVQAVELARRCHDYLAPEAICKSYNKVHPGHTSDTKVKEVLDALWRDCGSGTVLCVADGINVLASLWKSAYAGWRGQPISGALDEDSLRSLYEKPSFIESKSLSRLGGLPLT